MLLQQVPRVQNDHQQFFFQELEQCTHVRNGTVLLSLCSTPYKPPYSYGKEAVGEVIVRPANAARAAAADDTGAGGGTAGDGGAAAATADVAATSAESAK
jgi:hypothetical protein